MNATNSSSAVPSYRLYRERSEESGAFWLHCETIPARTMLHDWEIAVHRHDALFQIFSVTAGSGKLHGAGVAPRAFSAPCVLFIAPGAAHGFSFSRDVDGLVLTAITDRLRSLRAADRAIESFTQETRIVTFDDVDAAADVHGAVARIQAENTGRGAARALLLDALVTEAVVNLTRAGLVEPADDTLAPGRDRRRFVQLEALVETHFREGRQVSFYAGAVGVSAPHLNRLCRAHAGLSVQGLVGRRLMEAARRELVFTPTPVQAIAFGLGFNDAAYFNRFFRRMAGTTPGQYRRSERLKLASVPD